MDTKLVSPIKFIGIDLACGTLSSTISSLYKGLVQIIVGYPLDFVKTRIQLHGGDLLQILKIIRMEGFRTLYRGKYIVSSSRNKFAFNWLNAFWCTITFIL